MTEQLYYVRNRRTKMLVATQQKPKSAQGIHSYVANWRWVWKPEDAEAMTEFDAIHPIIQLDMEGKVELVPVDGPEDGRILER